MNRGRWAARAQGARTGCRGAYDGDDDDDVGNDGEDYEREERGGREERTTGGEAREPDMEGESQDGAEGREEWDRERREEQEEQEQERNISVRRTDKADGADEEGGLSIIKGAPRKVSEREQERQRERERESDREKAAGRAQSGKCELVKSVLALGWEAFVPRFLFSFDLPFFLASFLLLLSACHASSCSEQKPGIGSGGGR
ncbi:hypothetical protein CDD83_4060 [Cordyceps sp. RAO-2017]|nr:hypothetical protein CDD83_4060 [Cordyceps sp. RAO-2017]